MANQEETERAFIKELRELMKKYGVTIEPPEDYEEDFDFQIGDTRIPLGYIDDLDDGKG